MRSHYSGESDAPEEARVRQPAGTYLELWLMPA